MTHNSQLPKIALGAWAWGNDGTFGGQFTAEDLRPVFDAAMRAGLNLWDTAYAYGMGASEKVLGEIRAICPIVMCSEYLDEPNVSYVTIDNTESAKKAVEYLISTGCRKLGLLNSFSRNAYAREREKGFKEALQEAGLEINEERITHISSINYQSAFLKASYMLSSENRPDAIFATADVFAVAAINAAKKLGFRVPEDISVIGFDNVEAALMCDPQLTTVEQPAEEIGYQSCEILIENLQGSDTQPKHIKLETELIVRQSTKFNK